MEKTNDKIFKISKRNLENVVDELMGSISGISVYKSNSMLVNPKMIKEMWLHDNDNTFNFSDENISNIKYNIIEDYKKLNLPLVRFALWIYKKLKITS